jgi:hypothetical protein
LSATVGRRRRSVGNVGLFQLDEPNERRLQTARVSLRRSPFMYGDKLLLQKQLAIYVGRGDNPKHRAISMVNRRSYSTTFL